MNLHLLEEQLAVCRLDAAAELPEGFRGGGFWSITRTQSELSLVCAEELAPAGARIEHGWRCLMVKGPLDFSLVGILAELAGVLAGAGVSIFAISTFDTDYLLVKSADLEAALAALRKAGHRVGGMPERDEG